MKNRRRFLSILGLTAAVGLAAAFVAPSPDVAKVGEAAPEFKLKDTAGKEHSLADFKGKNVVLQWINPQCPVCVRVTSSGLAASMVKQLKELDKDIVILAINSTHFMAPEDSAAYLKEHKLDIPALVDQDGTVGHAYDARTTPHIYVIDKEGVLRYGGAFDDDPHGKKGAQATNYAVNTIKQILAGETVSPDSTKPYGCSVKYAKMN